MARKADMNQPTIVKALRGVGAKVIHLHELGHGVPDVLVLYRGEMYLLEIKMPGCHLTPDEQVFFKEWESGQVHVVTSPESALMAIGALD